MKLLHMVCRGLFVAALLIVPGCDSDPPPPPTLEWLEQLLSVAFPTDCRVIGGTESSESSSLCLIVSADPLPLPPDRDSKTPSRSSRGKRPAGTPFPVSALSNLLAASGVSPDDVPRLSDDRGASHVGQVGDWQFTYREAATESGWLTAVELHSHPSAGRYVVSRGNQGMAE
ncbi:hypothetical protein Mal15_33200 [Stieleria maiorica]|uniref:Uncharacterized protein n=1 Tax=Stieleria maiorica TaxID=2795974 RepID=A0A5B9MDU7_9BACT|nr:hypothetical protein [Stieleria maiorica]QEF99258.1 hypothetical protein Mal15_33200 [Stieleria maiorica]